MINPRAERGRPFSIDGGTDISLKLMKDREEREEWKTKVVAVLPQ